MSLQYRQIWELIKSEMQYVADLRAIDNVSDS